MLEKSIFLIIFVLTCLCSTALSGDEENKNEIEIIDSGFVPLEDYEAHRRNKTLRERIKLANMIKISQTTESNLQSRHNPTICDTFVKPTKNFNIPGRRISENKCAEYVWDLQLRYEEKRRKATCQALKQKVYAMKQKSGRPKRVWVVGGRPTLPTEFPHMGAIGWLAATGTWVFKCGSSLISRKYVLTAAHCSKASPKDTTVADIVPKIVRFGDKNIKDKASPTQKDVNISRIIVHPKYSSPKKYYDIALMELLEEVIFTPHVQPACLWPKDSLSELQTANVTGWGVVESAHCTSTSELLVGTLDIIDNEKCDSYLRNEYNRHFQNITEHQLCAGKLDGGVDACQGDSGGPLQVEMALPIKTMSQGKMHHIIGVTAFGIKCAIKNTPGIYTRVSAFLDWIEQEVWPNATVS